MSERKINGRTRSKGGRSYKSSAEAAVCRRRRLAVADTVMVVGEVRERGPRRQRMADVAARGWAGGGRVDSNPLVGIGKAIQDALDPVKAPTRVRTLADMSAEEIAALEQRTGLKVRR